MDSMKQENTQTSSPETVLTNYERRQRQNVIMAWIHSLRYKTIRRVFSELAPSLSDPINILEIGCAHAPLFKLLNDDYTINYHGIELDSHFVETSRARHQDFDNFTVTEASVFDQLPLIEESDVDVIVALETLEHIRERHLIRLVESFAKSKARYFIFSVPVEVGPMVWVKNISAFLMRYPRYKDYTWKETFWAGLYQLDKLPPHDIAHKGFDWRWLAQTLRHYLKIVKIKRLPVAFFPVALSNSVFFVLEKQG